MARNLTNPIGADKGSCALARHAARTCLIRRVSGCRGATGLAAGRFSSRERSESPRTNRHSPEPDHGCGEVDEAGEVNRPAIVARCEAAEVFEAIEAALDAVATFVGRCIVRDEDLPGSVGRDHRCRAEAGDLPSEGVAVIGFVGEHGTAGHAIDQSGSGDDIAHLAGRDDETQRTSQRVGKHVDLGGQSASGTPQRLILAPPFPLAACW